ncbi:MAG: hypothetical protein WA658_22595, partial [Candidatus Acidiferrales bacterium]
MKSTNAIANADITFSSTTRSSPAQRSIRRRNVLPSARTYLFLAFLLGGCGYAGSPPNHNITVTVQPTAANVALGQSQQFQASVIGASNGAVSWSVNGFAGGNSTSGTVSSSGVYTAPATLPSPATVTVTAVSQADPQASGSSAVTLLQTSIAVSVAPQTASVPTGGAQVFTATVSGTSSSGVTWSVNGITGGNSANGTVTVTSATTATYTAPADLPTTNPASIHATAGALVASASATIVSSVTVSVSPSS